MGLFRLKLSDNFRHMPTALSPTDNRHTVRLGRLSKELIRTAKRTGQNESEIMRAALSDFFAANTTPEQIIAAVITARSREVS